MKIVFIGGVEIGFKILEAIYETGSSVDTIFTLPKDSLASGYINFDSLANKNGTKLIRTNSINDEENIALIKAINPDLIVVCGWQRLVCKEILDIPRLGTIGFHSSLLPNYRGRAPVNWAIIMGEKETGITMFYLTEDADAGEIIAQKKFSILLNDDCNTVYKKSALAGCELIKEYLPKIENEVAPKRHNPSLSYPAYPKRVPKDGLIDFKRSSIDIFNFVRALTKPYPGAFYYNEDKVKVVVWKISILFDESDIKKDDIVFETLDYKVKLLEYSLENQDT